jgi:large subunit ribosomal protein L28
MARECEVCGKSSQMGNSVETRGKAKYLGGVGTKVTGITRRQFRPNLQRVKVVTDNGTHKTVRVCAQCIRSGAVRKVVRRKPFKLPGK